MANQIKPWEIMSNRTNVKESSIFETHFQIDICTIRAHTHSSHLKYNFNSKPHLVENENGGLF